MEHLWPTGEDWQEDIESTSCGLCQMTFSFLTRRHSCRCCGKAYCASCTSKRWIGHRVCDGCFMRLRTSKSTTACKHCKNLLRPKAIYCDQCGQRAVPEANGHPVEGGESKADLPAPTIATPSASAFSSTTSTSDTAGHVPYRVRKVARRRRYKDTFQLKGLSYTSLVQKYGPEGPTDEQLEKEIQESEAQAEASPSDTSGPSKSSSSPSTPSATPSATPSPSSSSPSSKGKGKGNSYLDALKSLKQKRQARAQLQVQATETGEDATDLVRTSPTEAEERAKRFLEPARNNRLAALEDLRNKYRGGGAQNRFRNTEQGNPNKSLRERRLLMGRGRVRAWRGETNTTSAGHDAAAKAKEQLSALAVRRERAANSRQQRDAAQADYEARAAAIQARAGETPGAPADDNNRDTVRLPDVTPEDANPATDATTGEEEDPYTHSYMAAIMSVRTPVIQDCYDKPLPKKPVDPSKVQKSVRWRPDEELCLIHDDPVDTTEWSEEELPEEDEFDEVSYFYGGDDSLDDNDILNFYSNYQAGDDSSSDEDDVSSISQSYLEALDRVQNSKELSETDTQTDPASLSSIDDSMMY